ncbi:MAG: UDP-N-acetylmuramoyl-L-alanyl-D-glutamate--2,6-diaminopimelate ligase [Pseudomonadota bacterium]
MKLATLMDRAGLAAAEEADVTVTGFAIDHRKVAPGTVFGAFKGARFNAEDFIPAAIEAGAAAVISSPEAVVEGALHIVSEQPRQTFAQLAAEFFTPVPAHIVAVTGTNGKTSTVEMTRQIWRMCGEPAASIGTLGVTTPDGSVATGLTTPDIVTFLSNMSGLSREGVTHVAYEASSHGLSQYRNEGLSVAAGAFTNFSRDHLDYHGTMEEYFLAKMRLFDEVVIDGGAAVIWDLAEPCEWTIRAIEHAHRRGLKLLIVGDAGGRHDVFLRLVSREATQLGQVLTLEYAGEQREVNLPLIGAYQASNALVSAGLALATGASPSQVFDAIGRLQPVRGRLERACLTPTGAPVYVDYAHTPDALEAAIAALLPHVDHSSTARLITVFGAGGDRDPGKRASMGAVAAKASDLVIVTDDNPRSEEPAAIRNAVLSGAVGADHVSDIEGRREAIAAAIRAAGANDIILIAGKGHEQGQIIGSGENMRILPFDDVEVARECAAELAQGAAL